MRSFGLFIVLFIVLIGILLASILVNYQNSQDLLRTKEFIHIGFLVFLVIGDEFVKEPLINSFVSVIASEAWQ